MEKKRSELQSLAISCTSSDCASNLHCFKFHKSKMTADQKGACRSCGAKLVDWSRVHKKDVSDIDYTFKALKFELFRHYIWHIDIDIRAANHARRKGMKELFVAAHERITKAIAPANPYRDGTQTPKQGNIIFYAQHATASCCRKCIEYWHDIPQGRDLTAEEIRYLVNLIMALIKERMPNLTEKGEYVPRIKA
jgi:Domain of unknown function (DUF4186)